MGITIDSLVRVKSKFYPFHWRKPNVFRVVRIDEGFGYLQFADGESIPSGVYQGAFIDSLEKIEGQLSLW